MLVQGIHHVCIRCEKSEIEKVKESELTEEELQRLLDAAVNNEDYESASRYRDMLKAKKDE